MTTIAWDGKTLAADRCSWSGGVRRQVRKVTRIETAQRGVLLVACAGKQAFCMRVLAWLRGDGDRPAPQDYFEQCDIGSQDCAVVVDSDRVVWCLSNTLDWCRMEDSIFAHGAGQEFAWGALEAGADARRAVEIAARRSDYAGFGVDSVSFE